MPDLLTPERLAQLVPFSALPAMALQKLLPANQPQRLSSGEILFRQGDPEDELVFVLEGTVEVVAGGRVVDVVEGGSELARHALCPGSPRSCSARARSDARILRVDRRLLDTALTWAQSATAQPDAEEWMTLLSRSPLFSRIPPANIRRIFALLEAVPVKAGQEIIRQGEAGDYYYVVARGRCAVLRQGSPEQPAALLAELGPGDSFGEEALISGSRRNATVRMLSDGVLRRLTRDAFGELIQEPVLRHVDRPQALAMARAGARFLDVRLPEEHRKNGIAGSLNIPLGKLRQVAGALPRDRRYIVYCDTAQRSSAATFLLAKQGFDAYLLAPGLLPMPGRLRDGASAVAAPEQLPPLVAAEQASAKLALEALRAHAKLEQAVRLRAASQAALVATEAEIARLQSVMLARGDTDLAEKVADRLAGDLDRLRQEDERQAEELEVARKVLWAAEEHKLAAEDAAAKLWAEAKRTENDLEQQARDRLQTGKQALEQAYTQADASARDPGASGAWAETELAHAGEALRAEWQRAESRMRAALAELQEARRVREEIRQRLADWETRTRGERSALRSREAELRQAAETRLRSGRERLELEFAQGLERLERSRDARSAAQAAKREGEVELARLREELRADQERLEAAAEARVQSERARLTREARQIQLRLEAAREDEARVLAVRQASRKRAQPPGPLGGQSATPATTPATTPPMAGEATADEDLERALAALEAARRAEFEVQVSRSLMEATEDRRESTEAALRHRMREELQDWLQEESIRERATQVRTLRGKEVVQVIDEQARAARRAEQERLDSLFDDVRSQLDGDGKE